MRTLAAALMVAFLLAPGLASHAATVDAEGMASIDGRNLEQVRQAAIRDALRQASIQAGARVESAELVTAGGLALESSRMRGTEDLSNVTIMREWQDKDLFHVRIRAENNASAGQPATSRSYKKKIVAAPFNVNKTGQVDDIDDIWSGFPKELLRRLESTHKFLPKVSKFSLPADARGVAVEPNGEHVKQLALLNESQFVVSGAILDAGTSVDRAWFGLSVTKRRRFEVEIFVHDGLTGALISHHRLDRAMEGEVKVGNDKPFGSAAFFATDYGRNVDWVMQALTKAILADLEPVPFTARIVRISGGKIFLDAGASSLLAPGDKLVAYRKKDEPAVIGLSMNAEYGMPEAPVATVSITQVQPLFSIGELSLDAKSVNLRVGDLVRFETVM